LGREEIFDSFYGSTIRYRFLKDLEDLEDFIGDHG
jgi:hypothetical protein